MINSVIIIAMSYMLLFSFVKNKSDDSERIFEKSKQNFMMFMVLLLDTTNDENKYNATLFQQVRSITK